MRDVRRRSRGRLRAARFTPPRRSRALHASLLLASRGRRADNINTPGSFPCFPSDRRLSPPHPPPNTRARAATGTRRCALRYNARGVIRHAAYKARGAIRKLDRAAAPRPPRSAAAAASDSHIRTAPHRTRARTHARRDSGRQAGGQAGRGTRGRAAHALHVGEAGRGDGVVLRRLARELRALDGRQEVLRVQAHMSMHASWSARADLLMRMLMCKTYMAA